MRLLRTLLPLIAAPAAWATALISPHSLAPDAYFEANHGQADKSVAFVSRGLGFTALLQRNGNAVYRPSSDAQGDAAALRIELSGRHAPLEAAGEQPLPAVTNYYRGSAPGGSHPGVRHYQSVRFRSVYADIDLVWRSRGPDLEYEFLVGAGADPHQIQVRFDGPSRIWLDEHGNLILETQGGRVCHRRAIAWQEIAGKRREIEVGVLLEGATARFQLGPYDHQQPLWIDPILSYSTYFGGAGFDAGYATTVDSSSGIYVTGTTASVGFPAQTSGQINNRDVFVSKFNESGALLYTTILSSSANTSGQAIAVDSTGDVYVAGTTAASDFPTTGGAWQTVFGGSTDAFALKLDPAGRLLYATYIGGAGQESGTGIAVDQSSDVYVSGYTSSVGFPTTAGAAQSTYRGGAFDAFVVKLNTLGSTAVYSTLLGGTGNDEAQAIAVDAAGHACIAGYTNSTDLPVHLAVQPNPGGEGDAMFGCLSADGSAWTSVSYLGGGGSDDAYALALDAGGNLYLAGTTFSADFPTSPGAFQAAPAVGYDAFVVKLSPGGGALTYATLLGGSGSDTGTAIAVGSAGDVWTGGFTNSTNFPLAGAWQSGIQGSFDGFLSHLSADGTVLLSSSYLGGSASDQVLGIALEPGGQVVATGFTLSTDFPVTPGAVQPIAPAGSNIFLAFIDPLSPGVNSLAGQVSVSGGGPLGGVAVSLSGAAGGSATTDSSGNYIFSDLASGNSYTLTPSLSGYGFSPPSLTFNNLNANQTANFTAIHMTFAISGQTTLTGAGALGGVAVSLSGAASGSTTTDSSGNYTFSALAGGGAYTLTPSLSGYTFTPTSLTFTNLSANQTARFTAAHMTFSISGQTTLSGIGLHGVTVSLSGAASGSTTTDSSGNYTFSALSGGGAYTLTPSLSGYTFTPTTLAFTNLSANQTARFAATHMTFSISGQTTLSGAGLRGVTVLLSGAASGSTTTDSSGNYNFSALASGGAYTLTPSLSGYTFTPTSQAFTSLSANQTAHFAAAAIAEPLEIFWQDPVSGASQVWLMGGPQGTTMLASASLSSGNPWHIAAVADFNGDGYPDLVWQDPATGESQVWFLGGPQGTTVIGSATITNANPWRIVAAGDFNGDGHPDLVWQDPVSGWAQIWYLGGAQGVTVMAAANLTLLNLWHIVGSGDFNGDGHRDLLWQDPVSGTVQVWYLGGAQGNVVNAAANLEMSNPGLIVATADFNGDGHPDVVAQDPVSGATQVLFLGGAQGTVLTATVGLTGPNPSRIVAPR